MLQQINVGEEWRTNLKSHATLLIKQLRVFKNRLISTRKKVALHRLDLVQKLKQKQNTLEKDFEGKINSIDENIKKLNEICQDTTGDLQKDKEVIEMLQKKTKENQQLKYRFYDLVEISRDMEPPRETDIENFEQEELTFEGIITMQ